MATDLERAYSALAAKQASYNLLWRYYDGDHPLVYSAERLRDIFDRLDARFQQNWCAVVVDATADRINLARWQVAGNEEATDALNGLFQATELNLDSDDAHLAALVCGEAFVIVWPDEAGNVEAYYNDPRLCHIQYEADNPRRAAWAAKWWTDDDGYYRLTLYYRDRLEYYHSTQKAQDVTGANAFEPDDPPSATNAYDIIPVFHLRRERRKVQSELTNAIAPQDAVNKLLSDMMVAAEFGAFRQRWVISNADDIEVLKNAPNEIWTIPAGDGAGQAAQVGEFGQTDLGVYLNAIDKLAAAISIITRTPKHYLYQQGGDPSGEALIAMEAPLVKKCGRYIERFTATWRRIGAFMLQLQGTTVDPNDVEAIFDKPETVQPRTRSEMRQMDVAAGIPLKTVLRAEGWTEGELQQMDKDAAEATRRQADGLAAALMRQQREFDQGANT